MTKRFKNPLYYVIMRTHDLYSQWHKYTKVTDPEQAYRRSEKSKMISVPITCTSNVKRSRIKNVYCGSRVYSTIEQFNEKYNLQKTLEDIPVKR